MITTSLTPPIRNLTSHTRNLTSHIHTAGPRQVTHPPTPVTLRKTSTRHPRTGIIQPKTETIQPTIVVTPTLVPTLPWVHTPILRGIRTTRMLFTRETTTFSTHWLMTCIRMRYSWTNN